MKYLFLDVSGMICAGCSNAIKKSLLGYVGVRKANVDHLSGHAIVAYEPKIQNRFKLISVIENLGYQAMESKGFLPHHKNAVIKEQDKEFQTNH